MIQTAKPSTIYPQLDVRGSDVWLHGMPGWREAVFFLEGCRTKSNLGMKRVNGFKGAYTETETPKEA